MQPLPWGESAQRPVKWGGVPNINTLISGELHYGKKSLQPCSEPLRRLQVYYTEHMLLIIGDLRRFHDGNSLRESGLRLF